VTLLAVLVLWSAAAAFVLFFVFVVLRLQRKRVLQAFPVPVPGLKARMNAEAFEPVVVRHALERVVSLWKNTFSFDATKTLDMLKIEWVVGEDGERFYWLGDKRVAGHASLHYVSIAYLESDRLGQTAFFHEVAHVLHRAQHGDSDNNHLEPGGPWTKDTETLINRLKSEFA